jgi:hypothetical protein
LSLGIGLFAIWAAISTATTYLAGLPIKEHLVIIGVIFTFYVFLLLLFELYVVVSPTVNKIGILLLFIIGIYAILPIVLASLFSVDALAPHSPVGYLGYAAFTLDQNQDITTHLRVAIVNILLCVIPAILILRRHAGVIKARQRM